METLPIDLVRNLSVVKQGLHERPTTINKGTLKKIIRTIGILQLDSVNVVQRSHYLVMHSRAGVYDTTKLDELLYPDRFLFEQWTHCVSLMPAEDAEWIAPTWLARRNGNHRYQIERLENLDAQQVMDEVLSAIRERGPLGSAHFDDLEGRRGSWWDHKPAKHALNALFDRGYLMVHHRENFHIRYDLAERVLPAAAQEPSRTLDDYKRWATLRGLHHLGVGTAKHICDYYRIKLTDARTILKRLVDAGEVEQIAVEGWAEPVYLDPAIRPLLNQIARGKHAPTLTTFLSPFDNLIWDRNRNEQLFDFHYRIEIYTPAPKRKYGYYVMPILHKGRVVGRIDPKADRASSTLRIRGTFLEEGERVTDELVDGIAGALREFAAFHKCENIVIEASEPAELKIALGAYL